MAHEHGETLHGTRNRLAWLATTTWLCFLDAGDRLAPGYLDAMARAAALAYWRKEWAPLLAPAFELAGQRLDLAARDPRHLNPCVIGTLVTRATFWAAGGFLDEPYCEDWSLWLRCLAVGARIVHVPDACYRACRSDGRNQPDQSTKDEWYWTIRRRYAQ